MKEYIVAGNWKMFKGVRESVDFTLNLSKKVLNLRSVKLILCPPFTSLFSISEILRKTSIGLGAQNMHFAKSGAFTGEISGEMLLSAGCEYVILGHSERRHVFHETFETIKSKIDAALAQGLKPIICVGEKIEERQAGQTENVIRAQYESACAGLSAEDLKKCIIAYEPVWAIGTGLTATPQQASEMHQLIRHLFAVQFSVAAAEETTILYGGSVKPENARELIETEGIDGFLVGGASLEEEKFVKIADAVDQFILTQEK